MSWPNQPPDGEAQSRSGSAGEPATWYTSQPAKCGPLTCQSRRASSEVRTKAPLRVPTRTRTPAIATSDVSSCRSGVSVARGYDVRQTRISSPRHALVGRGQSVPLDVEPAGSGEVVRVPAREPTPTMVAPTGRRPSVSPSVAASTDHPIVTAAVQLRSGAGGHVSARGGWEFSGCVHNS